MNFKFKPVVNELMLIFCECTSWALCAATRTHVSEVGTGPWLTQRAGHCLETPWK